MIKIKNQPITVTKFPDGTSQVWKLPENIILIIKYGIRIDIDWDFEEEAEIIHVLQLCQLIEEINDKIHIVLNCPFLPYGRQDKDICLNPNEITWSLQSFADIVNIMGVHALTTVDAHSEKIKKYLTCGFINFSAIKYIMKTIKLSGSTALCFPDSGSQKRYQQDIFKEQSRNVGITGTMAQVVLEKVRDQSTGEIIGLHFSRTHPNDDLDLETVLMIDDICDGGRTFVEAAKLLKRKHRDITINLYVSHGIFSKGLDPLFDAGISNIYTHKGLVKSENKPAKKSLFSAMKDKWLKNNRWHP